MAAATADITTTCPQNSEIISFAVRQSAAT